MLRLWQIFICVIEEGGMTKAAAKLHMAQPSVSQAIRELEEHYGSRLFERFGHRLILTDAGECLRDYAYELLRLDAQTEAAMKVLKEQAPLRIGASVTIGESILVALLQEMAHKCPDQELISEIHNTAELETMLLNNDLDIALVEGEIQSDYIKETIFMTDELIFIAAPTSPIATKKNIAPSDLKSQRFYIREKGSGTRMLFEAVMVKAHITYGIAGVYNNAESLKNAVKAGLGISVISRRSVQPELDNQSLVQLNVPGLSFRRTFRIAYHKNKYLSPILLQFMTICRHLEKGRR